MKNTLNPCKCGSKEELFFDSDDMIECWMVQCPSCEQKQHAEGSRWTYQGAINKWNAENPKRK